MSRINRMSVVALLTSAMVLSACGTSSGTGTTTTLGPKPSTSAPPSTIPPTTQKTNPPVTVGVKVWFLDEPHAVTGEEPLYRPVDRQVQPPAVAAGALDALFAGPTTAEQQEGLRLITSGATGYSHLHIDSGIAYVTLEGSCASNGSTMTIAGEIFPILKQFSSVTWVKIFDPQGNTEAPTGNSDSIPFCLEP